MKTLNPAQKHYKHFLKFKVKVVSCNNDIPFKMQLDKTIRVRIDTS